MGLFNVNDEVAQLKNIVTAMQEQTEVQREGLEKKPFLTLEIDTLTPIISTQTHRAVILANGTIWYQPSTFSRGPVALFENETASFIIHIYNSGNDIAALDRIVASVISKDKTHTPKNILVDIGEILKPESDPLDVSLDFTVEKHMAPSGIISIELQYSSGSATRELPYEYFVNNPFDSATLD